MKRNRMISLLLALTMLFVLAACGQSAPAADSALKDSLQNAVNEAKAEPTPEPTPEPTVVGLWEAEVDMRDQMVSEMDAQGLNSKSFGEYFDSFIWMLTMELTEDTYTLSYDISKDMDSFKSAVVAYMRDAIYETAGTEVSDEAIAQALGMPLEDYAQTVVDAMLEAATTESAGYREEDGKLIWEDGAESPYELTADTLKFSVNSLGELFFRRIG